MDKTFCAFLYLIGLGMFLGGIGACVLFVWNHFHIPVVQLSVPQMYDAVFNIALTISGLIVMGMTHDQF